MDLNIEQLESLQEVINIGVGQAAGVLNEMLGSHIDLNIPFIDVLTSEFAEQKLKQQLDGDHLSVVELRFTGSLVGDAALVFSKDSASKLMALLLDEDMGDTDLDSLKIGALTEVGNIVISGVMGAISNLLGQHLDYLLPDYLEGSINQLLKYHRYQQDTTILLAQTHFNVRDMDIQGDILLLFNVASFNHLLTAIERLFGGV